MFTRVYRSGESLQVNAKLPQVRDFCGFCMSTVLTNLLIPCSLTFVAAVKTLISFLVMESCYGNPVEKFIPLMEARKG